MRRLFASLLFTAAMLGAAQAADCYPNATGTQANCGEVQMFNNASGQSQPVTAAAPLPTVAGSPAVNTYIGNVNTEGTKATYSASGSGNLVASATDVYTITGSASKTIRITRVQISGYATAANSAQVFLVKRSTANTSGTFTASTVVPHDSSSAAGTGTAGFYTVNPTTGSLVGILRAQMMTFAPLATPAVDATPIVWDFTTRNGQGIVLRGVAQQVSISLGGVTISGGVAGIDVEWTEE